jgi:hypothetical protein
MHDHNNNDGDEEEIGSAPHLDVLHLKTHQEFQALAMMEVVDVVIIAPITVVVIIHPRKQ